MSEKLQGKMKTSDKNDLSTMKYKIGYELKKKLSLKYTMKE